jgi:hypothetical protein
MTQSHHRLSATTQAATGADGQRTATLNEQQDDTPPEVPRAESHLDPHAEPRLKVERILSRRTCGSWDLQARVEQPVIKFRPLVSLMKSNLNFVWTKGIFCLGTLHLAPDFDAHYVFIHLAPDLDVFIPLGWPTSFHWFADFIPLAGRLHSTGWPTSRLLLCVFFQCILKTVMRPVGREDILAETL